MALQAWKVLTSDQRSREGFVVEREQEKVKEVTPLSSLCLSICLSDTCFCAANPFLRQLPPSLREGKLPTTPMAPKGLSTLRTSQHLYGD